jgi:hypothetical protein
MADSDTNRGGSHLPANWRRALPIRQTPKQKARPFGRAF